MKRCNNGRTARCQGTQQLEHRELMMRIKMIGRLIHQKNLRLLGEEPGDCDAALLAAGERVGAAFGTIRQIQLRKRPARNALILAPFPLPGRKMRMAADEHALKRRRREPFFRVL